MTYDPSNISSFYQKISDSNLWIDPNAEQMKYSDGVEVEAKLRAILGNAKDLSVDSLELRSSIDDWPTLYYFSPLRANLLRPFREILSRKVLEIGAGCGSLTRFLGENSEQVLAVEGSIERAKLCAERCRDLSNVNVLCEKFEDIKDLGKFDVVTLVGVLEYARIYGEGINGPLNLLRRAREFLTPNGILIIAIENQLGAKYFAGANEDHLEAPWIGVEDRYKENGVVTFGKQELNQLILSSGFSSLKNYLPFPDYKFPVSILVEDELSAAYQAGLDPALFAVMATSADYQRQSAGSFSLELAWSVIGRNKILGDLSNSFVVLASNSQQALKEIAEKKQIVFHYGSPRKKQYSKETIIKNTQSGLKVEKILLGEEQENLSSPFRNLSGIEQFMKGELFIEKLFKILNQEAWKIEDIVNWVKPWFELLLKNIEGDRDESPKLLKARLPANFLDATPFNLVIGENTGQLSFIDLEWSDIRKPLLIHVLIRGLISSFDKLTFVSQPADGLPSKISYFFLIDSVLKQLGLNLSEEDWDKVLDLENQFRIEVTGLSSSLTTSSLQHRILEIKSKQNFSNRKLVEASKKISRKKSISIEIIKNYNLWKNLSAFLDKDSELNRIAKFNEFLKSRALAANNHLQRAKRKQSILKNLFKDFYSFLHHPINKTEYKSGFRGLIKFLMLTRVWIIIRLSGVFDYEFYGRVHSDLKGERSDLLTHYIRFGAIEQRQPNMLFDAIWYQKYYNLPEANSLNPLLHYILEGSKKDYSPHPLFDSKYYNQQLKGKKSLIKTSLAQYQEQSIESPLSPHPLFLQSWYVANNKNKIACAPLSDYLENWRNRGEPNPFFDTEYYLSQNRDLARKAGVNPLVHFLLHSDFELKDPSSAFSLSAYYDLNLDVRNSGINGLVHFMRYGAVEGRHSLSVRENLTRFNPCKIQKTNTNNLLLAKQPTLEEWNSLSSRSKIPDGVKGVDVIIPVYKGMVETLACIVSVLKTESKIPFRLIVVNDKSPEPALSAELRHWASMDKFFLIENETNLGFVRSVNTGMSYSKDNDVLLLNSDTEVFADWLDRINKAAYSEKNIATVTPFSNSATICSYPNFCQDRSEAFELDISILDQIAAEVNKDCYEEIPTAVGFCMYIKREAIQEVGLFDAEKFGQGYGEENEFCLRASKLGWKHILASNVFVTHYGSTSFGDSRASRVAVALETIRSEYPNYERDVEKFVKKDPLAAYRFKIDLERASRSLSEKRFLFISHSRGGGTGRHMQILSDRLLDLGVSTLYLEPNSKGEGIFIRIPGMDRADIPTLSSIDFKESPDLLDNLIDFFDISHAHIHSLIDFSLAIPDWLFSTLKKKQIAYDVTVHDHAWFCPRINMIDGSNFYCGGAEEVKCQKCIDINNSAWGFVSIKKFKTSNLQLLRGARRVICPNTDVYQRMHSAFPDCSLTVLPHELSFNPQTKTPKISRSGIDKRKVALLGAVGPHKGSAILLSCVEDAFKRNLPLSFHVIGYLDNQDKLAKYPNIVWTGPYKEDQVYNILKEQDCDICWFPAIWPETFSYTLNIAFNAGLYPVAFNFGAIAERIKSVGWGELIDHQLWREAGRINDILLNLEINSSPNQEKIRAEFAEYHDILKDYYQL